MIRKERIIKRLGTQENVLPSVKLREPAILKSILGLGFIILTYIYIGGIHADNIDRKDTYTASIFGPDFAAGRIIQPNVAIHTPRSRNTDTFSDSIVNLSAWYQRGKETKFTKTSQFTFKKIVLDDEYGTGTQFFVINKQYVFRVIADNSFDGTIQTEINYTKLENSPSEFKVCGRDYKSWDNNFIKSGNK
jgi:hypothetical protein